MKSSCDSSDILARMRAKRGYLLPYHDLFYFLDPELLEHYDCFYERLTLRSRHLDDRTKESVWMGILIAAREEAGRIHLERAEKAGVSQAELAEVAGITVIASGYPAAGFVSAAWPDALGKEGAEQAYLEIVERGSRASVLSPQTRELVFIGVHTALGQLDALRLHLKRAREAGVSDGAIAEAMSYVFIPRGGNILLEAAGLLKQMVADGDLEAGELFGAWRTEKKE